MTDIGTSIDLTWDYLNRPTQWSNGTATSTYSYDHTTERVKKTTAGVSTIFPNDYYMVEGATTTKTIYGGEDVVATVDTASSTSNTYYVHNDHLGGTNIVTNTSGGVTQTLDYYPYGSTRVDTGTDVSSREFIGEITDEESGLSYLNARMYSGTIGKFISQDPVFWEVGQTEDGKTILKNPQAQNSYSYAQNSPITQKDPSGRFVDTLVDLGFIAYDSYRVADAYLNGGDVQTELGYLALDMAGAATPFATGFGAVARTVRITNKADEVVEGGIKMGQVGGLGAKKPFSKFVKDKAFDQANGKCVFCGVNTSKKVPGPTQANTDHSIPRAQGGNNTIDNAQNTCRSCNQSKGSNNSLQFVQKQLIKALKSYIKKLRR